MMKTDYLFVYGTLLSAFENQLSILLKETADFVGEAEVPGIIYQVAWYPGLVIDQNSSKIVKGQLFRFKSEDHKEKAFLMLDEYEGVGKAYPHPNEFRKVVTSVKCNGQNYEAMVYEYNRPTDDLDEIESGDYVDFAAKMAKKVERRGRKKIKR